MKLISLIVFVAVHALPAAAQDAASDDALPPITDGAMKPGNLSGLATSMKGKVTDIVSEDIKMERMRREEAAVKGNASLFAGEDGEDPEILEIKAIARDLDNQRSLMMQIANLQDDLIAFAQADPSAAHKSRIPITVCNYALQDRFCEAMTGSFQAKRSTETSE